MKNKFLIKFETVEDAAKYLNYVERFNSNIDIVHGNICVDGKSMGGVFNLDFGKTYELTIYTNDKNELNEFKNYIKEFLAEDE